MTINVEHLLREGKIHLPQIELFDSEEFHDTAYSPLGLTNSRKVNMYASKDAGEFFEVNSKEYKLERNAKMIYYAVFFGLSLDDQPAYQVVSRESLESIIENKLGNNIPEYTRLGEEILATSGIELELDDPEEVKEGLEEEISEESLATGISDYE